MHSCMTDCPQPSLISGAAHDSVRSPVGYELDIWNTNQYIEFRLDGARFLVLHQVVDGSGASFAIDALNIFFSLVPHEQPERFACLSLEDYSVQ